MKRSLFVLLLFLSLTNLKGQSLESADGARPPLKFRCLLLPSVELKKVAASRNVLLGLSVEQAFFDKLILGFYGKYMITPVTANIEAIKGQTIKFITLGLTAGIYPFPKDLPIDTYLMLQLGEAVAVYTSDVGRAMEYSPYIMPTIGFEKKFTLRFRAGLGINYNKAFTFTRFYTNSDFSGFGGLVYIKFLLF